MFYYHLMKKQFNREVHISTFAGNKYCAELREDDRVVFRVIFDSITRYSSMISDWQHGKSWTYFNLLFVMTPKRYQKNFRYTFNDGLPKE